MNAMVLPLVLGMIGLALSALFSGSETGLYRVSRIRLRLEAIEGNWVARWLLWLVYRPGLFVATTLVGNNLANNMVSLGVVLFSQAAAPQWGHLTELLLTALLTPLVFVYGELLPKYLFLRAPNRLLRQASPVLLGFTLLFLPISIFVWGINWLIHRVLGGSVQPVRVRLARRELRRLLEDAHELGVLQPIQRRLADALFSLAQQPVAQFALGLEQFPRVPQNQLKKDILQQQKLLFPTAEILVEDQQAPDRLIGYVELWELRLSQDPPTPPMHPLLPISSQEKFLSALIQMERQKVRLALLVDPQGNPQGVLSLSGLETKLLHPGVSLSAGT